MEQLLGDGMEQRGQARVQEADTAREPAQVVDRELVWGQGFGMVLVKRTAKQVWWWAA